MESEEQNLEIKRPVPTEDLNIEVLPVVYEIIRGIEKDHQDNTVKTRESLDTSQKVLELQKRLDQARADIRSLPGIEFNKEQQLNQLEALKTQLRLKQELIQKLLANNEQLVQRLSDSYPMRKAAQLVVRGFFHGKNFIEENRLHEKLTPEQFRALMRDVAANLQKQIKEAQDNIQRKMKQ